MRNIIILFILCCTVWLGIALNLKPQRKAITGFDINWNYLNASTVLQGIPYPVENTGGEREDVPDPTEEPPVYLEAPQPCTYYYDFPAGCDGIMGWPKQPPYTKGDCAPCHCDFCPGDDADLEARIQAWFDLLISIGAPVGCLRLPIQY
jgi:hypothetical protein